MLVNHNPIVKTAKFSKISLISSLLQNDLLDHRVYFDFKTETVEYRLRLLPMAIDALQPQPCHVQIDFTCQGQTGIAFCETSLITALMDLEASDFDISKLTPSEQNAAFRVLQRMIEENTRELSGLVIQQMQLSTLKIIPKLPLQLLLKVTSVEHFSYIHLQLSANYGELLLPLIKLAPWMPAGNNLPAITVTQDLDVHGCQLNQKELASLEIGDVLLFYQSATDYRICLANHYRFSLSPSEKGLSLLALPLADNKVTGDLFDISIKLHQALISDAEDDTILQVAQQQIEHSKQQPLKTLYCNQKPFALAEGIYISNQFGMRLQRFL